MINLNEYILLPKSERQKHIDLSLPCIERGGNSTNHKGVLAQFLNTNIPAGRILLCHACNNGKCSEARHLYWGTDKENIVEDGTKFDTWKPLWERKVEKYGYDEACKINAKGDKSLGGKANKGKTKTQIHKDKIAKSVKNSYNNRVIKSTVGRKQEYPYSDLITLVKEKGIKGAANEINISVAALRSRYYNALKATDNDD